MEFIIGIDEAEEDIDIGGAVYPSKACPHLMQNVDVQTVLDALRQGGELMQTTCTVCEDNNENWMCLQCGEISCSRYVHSHGEMHWMEHLGQRATHCVCLSFSDLNVWCYECASYVKHNSLMPILVQAESKKFECAPKTHLLPPILPASYRAGVTLPTGAMDEHERQGTECAEGSMRTTAIMEQLLGESASLLGVMTVRNTLGAEQSEFVLQCILNAHSKEYVDSLRSRAEACGAAGGSRDEIGEQKQDIFYTKQTYQACLDAVGCALTLMECMLRTTEHVPKLHPVDSDSDPNANVADVNTNTTPLDRGLVIARPPGHHASATAANGFCHINTAAVAAVYARDVYHSKVMILDLDIHHGDGTQSIFAADPNVLTISIHRQRWLDKDSGEEVELPPAGAVHQQGTGKGAGYNINVPMSGLEAPAKDQDYYYLFEQLVLPAMRSFQPDVVVVALGFDASIYDATGTQGGFMLSTQGYRHLLKAVMQNVPKGRVLCTLEGGYNISGLATNTEATVEALGAFDPAAASVAVTGLPWSGELPQLTEVLPSTVATVLEVDDAFRAEGCLWWKQ